MNPLHVKKSKGLDDNSPTKNDVKDAKVIAQLVKDCRYSIPNIPQGIYARDSFIIVLWKEQPHTSVDKNIISKKSASLPACFFYLKEGEIVWVRPIKIC